MTLSSQSIKKKDWREKRQLAFVKGKIAKIVNAFLTEIYISCPVDFKVVFVC